MPADRPPRRDSGASRLTAAGLGGACLLAALVAALVARLIPATLPAEAPGPRTVEASLTGIPFAPLAVPVRGERVTPVDWRVLAAAAQAKDTSDAAPTPANLQAFGVAALQAASLDTAVQALEDAAVADPDNAAIQSDLSAAYLARSATKGHAIDAARAIAAAARAMRLNPRLAAAAFNYALVLERLAVRQEAMRAWDAYLRRFGNDPGWADDARRRREALTVAPPLLPPARAAEADTRLGIWAREAIGDPDGASVPDLAAEGAFHAAIATDLASSHGPARRALAEVVRDLLAAEAALLTPSYTEVNRLAVSVLARPLGDESPLRLWALRLRLSAGFNTGTTMDQRRAVEALAEAAHRLRFTALEGDARHRLGAFDYVAGRYERAHEHYVAALALRESLGNVRGAVASRVALADALRMLGRDPEAWEHYGVNLKAEGLGDPALENVRLVAPAGWALGAGQPAVAVVFAREAAHFARSIDHPGLLTFALVLQARALHRGGDTPAAAAMLGRAREALASLDDEAIRNRHLAEIVQTDAEVLAATAPAAAVAVIADAEARLKTNVGQALLALAVLEARVHRSLGDLERARAALRKGVALVEAQQQSIGQDQFLPSFIDASWDVFSEFVDLEATATRDDEALRWLDRGFDIRRRWSRDLTASPLADASRLGPLVTYLARPDALWIWVVRAGQVTSRRVAVPRQVLVRRAARLGHVLALGAAPEPVHAAATALARDIWWPVADLLGAGGERPGRVALVLDPVLQRVPFALLPWEGGGDARVVDVTATVLCASIFACRGADGPLSPGARVAALHAGQGGQGLAALPTARDEAERVGRRYGGAHVEVATEAALARALTSSDVVHFSGHAVADEHYPRRSELLLATAGGDGVRVPLGRLLDRGVHADLVVLSACRTSRAEARRGEGGIGIAGEFLRAGARHVLATQWDVKDDVAGLAMDLMHEALATGVAPWDAVRHAQQIMRRDITRPARDWAGYVAYTSVSGMEQSTDATAPEPPRLELR